MFPANHVEAYHDGSLLGLMHRFSFVPFYMQVTSEAVYRSNPPQRLHHLDWIGPMVGITAVQAGHHPPYVQPVPCHGYMYIGQVTLELASPVSLPEALHD